ncbi:MAG: hypothetical protein JW751_00420 [Polyangiaceae bacterium]|nr:hypothetical protein [Polyangiaceae bacterium]
MCTALTLRALVIGQGTVEGVRRLCTASAQVLLRVALRVPGLEWVRTVLRREGCFLLLDLLVGCVHWDLSGLLD